MCKSAILRGFGLASVKRMTAARLDINLNDRDRFGNGWADANLNPPASSPANGGARPAL